MITSSSATRRSPRRRWVATLIAITLAGAVSAVLSPSARADIVAPVPLGTAAGYSVLAGTTVTNTGPSVLDGNLGVAPGSAVVGFPPGIVNPPSTIQAGTAAASTAQADLTTAYDNAAGRPVTATVAADLAGATLVGGVYAATGNGPLGLTGTVTLDGADNPSSVFIFQTGSTLITGTDSRVELINGAQECNVFWQVGSSATVGVRTTFRGTIMALTSVTVETGATVDGRALARNGAVTLDTNVFTHPTCETTTTTTAAASSTSTASSTTTTAPSTTTTTASTSTSVAPTTTTTTASTSTSVAPTTTTTASTTTTAAPTTTTMAPSTTTTVVGTDAVFGGTGTAGADSTHRAAGPRLAGERQASSLTRELPRTGAGPLGDVVLLAGACVVAGTVLLRLRSGVRRASR